MQVYFGKIALFSGDFVPLRWTLCNGKRLDAREYASLEVALTMQGTPPERDINGFYLPKLDDIGKCRQVMCVEAGAFTPPGEEDNIEGFIVPLEGKDIPENWVLCNGARMKLAEGYFLFKIIQERFGPKNADTFVLPNLNQPGGKRYIICVKGHPPQREDGSYV